MELGNVHACRSNTTSIYKSVGGGSSDRGSSRTNVAEVGKFLCQEAIISTEVLPTTFFLRTMYPKLTDSQPYPYKGTISLYIYPAFDKRHYTMDS